MSVATVGIRAVGRYVPTSIPLEELDAPLEVEEFRKRGFQRVAVERDLSVEEMALEAAEDALGRADLERDEIGALIYCNCFFPADFTFQICNRILHVCRLRRAFAVGLYQQGCANFTMSVRMARNLILAEGLRHVLIVCADAVQDDRDREIAPLVAVVGDGAAACIVSRESRHHHIRAIQHAHDGSLWNAEKGTSFMSVLKVLSGGLRQQLRAVVKEAGIGLSDVKLVCPVNVAIPAVGLVSRGLSMAHTYVENVGRLGHLLASDNLINYVDAIEDKRIEPGEYAVMFGSAFGMSWGSLLVRY